MLSYRHAFHAGNHADVLKHFVLTALLRHLALKDRPFAFIDTHAGAGQYRLDEGHATQNQEYQSGIAKLWGSNQLPLPLMDYISLVRTANPEGILRTYPGSPCLARQILRPRDSMRLFELHPGDYRLLGQNLKGADHVKIELQNGFSGLKASLPPPQRRALILIDPSYEDKTDYRQVNASLQDSLKRFETGIYAVWYPILNRPQARQLPPLLKSIHLPWINITLQIARPAADGFGMVASGMFVVHPPWTLARILQESLPALTRLLGQDETASFTVETSPEEIHLLNG